MIGGLLQPAADIPNRGMYERYGNVEGCSKDSQFRDVWVFNPRGWSRAQILGEAAGKYPEDMPDSAILPRRYGYDVTQRNPFEHLRDQSFADFRLSDNVPGPNGLTIDSALEAGWECTGVQGKWCRKPFLPLAVKGPETLVTCFEYAEGEETYQEELHDHTGKCFWGESIQIPRRPRVCSMDETANPESNCICYLINISGQSGMKNQPNSSGFRPEVNYLEIRRADGTFGSERPFYKESVTESCPNAKKVHDEDAEMETGLESPVADFTKCVECSGEGCNRIWKKRNLRKKWHEAGRIKYSRVGFMAASFKLGAQI